MEPARRVAYGVANQRFLVTTKETEVKNLVLLFALAGAAGFIPQAIAARSADVTPVADVSFTLRTEISEGRLVFVGDGGAIKGQVNPELKVPEGSVVAITVINGDGAMHDVAVPEFNAQSDQLVGVGSATTIVFRANKAGTFEYVCTIPGHKAAGMFGKLRSEEHTSELQSLMRISYAVFCSKKKNTATPNPSS